MNRRDRRAQARDPRSASNIRELERRVEATGRPGLVYGLTDACRDCTATGDLVLHPGGRVVAHVHHDAGCPAAAGVTQWQPHPINETR